LRTRLKAAVAVLGAAGVIAAGSQMASASSLTASTPATTALTLKVNPATETYGKGATVTGTLTSGSAGVAGRQVWVSTTKTTSGELAKGTTTATGAFSITLPNRASGGTLYAGSTSATSAALTLKVVHPTTISSFKASLSQYWKLSVSGCLGLPASDKTEKITHTTGLTVQYKAAGGYWNKLGVIPSESDHACGTGGIEFTGSFPAKLNSADYRVVYSGTTGVTSFGVSGSNALLEWRFNTRITGFTITPTTVNAGGSVTVKGTLQYLNKSWLNYGGQPLVVGLVRKGSSTWTWPFVVKTNASGQFSATFKVPYTSTWQVRFNGNNTTGGGHLSSWTPWVAITLK
jgi:hypothetical protein